MAAGNTIVLKPSEDTPYCGGLFFAEVLEETGVPPGVFNVVTSSRDRVAEMDVNPLIATPEGAFAADCLILPRQSGSG